MKRIKTAKFKAAQNVYDPDIDETEDLEIDYETSAEELPVLTKDDIGESIPQAGQDKAVEEDVRPVEADQSKFPEFGSAMDAMQWAIDEGQRVRLHYTCNSGHFIIRDIEPHAMFQAETTNRPILVAWDNNANWYRSYSINDIQKYEWRGEDFSPRFTFEDKPRDLRRR